jgi:hypothetical protein
MNNSSVKPSMPKGPAPMSKADIDFVKKKISAPSGPPPNVKQFSAPKALESSQSFKVLNNPPRYNDDDDDDDDWGSSDRDSDAKSGNGDEKIKVREKKSVERSVDNYEADIKSNKMLNNSVSRDMDYMEIERGESKEEEKSSSDTIFNFRPLLRATYRVLRDFVLTPCEKNIVTRCYIERSIKASEMFAPRYSLCADLEDGTGRELIVCKKILTSRSAHYGE